MPDALDNFSGAGHEDDDFDFRPLTSTLNQKTNAPRTGSDDELDFRPIPPLHLETLHEKQPGPIGAAAGTISLTRSMEPPKYPMPPKPTGLEGLSRRSKTGNEITSGGVKYHFDGLNWNPVGAGEKPYAPAEWSPAPVVQRLAEAAVRPGTVLATAATPSRQRPNDFNPIGQAVERFGEKPLLDVAHAVATPGQPLSPAARGLAEFGSEMTTPASLGLLAAAGPFEELPVAAQRIVSTIFGAQMAKGLYEQSRPFREAVARKDWDTAAELGGQMVPEAAMTFAAGAHALKGTPQALRVGTGELARRTGATGGLLEEMGREPQAGTTFDRTKAAWEPVARGQTAEDLNAQRAGDLRANAAGARGMANLQGRTNLKVPPVRPLALPPARPTPVETIGGEPVNVRIYPSDEAPLITPQPARTPEGAIITPRSPLFSRPLLPPAGAPLPPEEGEFLAGKSVPVPRLTSAVRPGPVESYVEGYRPRLTTSSAVRTAPSTRDIDFKPLTEQPAATKPNGKAAAAAQASAHAMGVGPPPDAVRGAIRRFRDIKEETKQGSPLQTAAEAAAVVRAREGAPPVAGPKLRLRVTPRSESLKTYYSLSQEGRDYVDSMAREMAKMPQILREGRMEELKQYGGKGTMLKERLAHEALKDAPEQAAGTKAAPIGPSVDVQIRELQARERALSEQSGRARSWPRALELIRQAKAVNEKWQALKAKQGGGTEPGPTPETERPRVEAPAQAPMPTPGSPGAGLLRSREGILPGLEGAVSEQQRATGQYQAGQLTEQINRPAESVETAAGEMESKSPLFRGTEASPQSELFKKGSRLSAGVDPTMLREGARIAQQAWQEKIARPFIDKVLKIGDKYQKARAADPAVAEGLHLLDNAPQYLRQKAAQQVHEVIGNLSRAQERLFVLMADADSRENLRANHPAEYREALNDRAVQEALRKYQPLERELTATRQRLGGETLEGDYLKRVYDKYVAGIGKEQAPGSTERGTSAYDRVIRPQRIGNMSREAAAEYHYKNGLHEFGPAFATKFIGTNLRALRDTVAKEFLSKATQLEPGAPEPRSIQYSGERYYRPDIVADMPKGTKVYDRYDPTAGEKFPQAADGKFLGPREVVRTLNDFGRREESEPGGLRRFFQEQVIGFGFGVPHVANILRRVAQSVPGGALSPKGWADAWRVAFSKELRERGIQGINDPTFDKLLRQGAITTGEMSNLKKYWGGNWNPANWARAMAQVGHKVLFEPGSAGGFGGIDQRARLHIADLIRSQRPELSDEQIASGVRDALGDYNRANWADRQKMLAKFMMFPGWDASSVRWVLQHPIRTTVPPAVLVYLANQTLHHFGQNRPEDARDIDTIHVGDRAYGTGLLRESVARNLFRPFINYAQVKLQGGNEQHAQAAAARGLTSGAGGLLGMLRPDLSGFLALATNRQALFSGKELLSRDDFSAPGKILPSRALEKTAVFAVRKAIPSLDRMLDSDQELDLKSFAGGNLGLPNYRDDAERRLVRNAAQAEETYQTVSKLAKTNPAKAREYMRDPDNAAYALFHRDFAQVVAALKRIDQTWEHVEASGLTAAEKKSRLAALDKSRQTLLGHADTLNNVLFERRQKAPQPRLAPGFLNQPRSRIPLAIQ